MSEEKEEPAEKTCFVVMGFGKKTDFESGRTLDLNMSYQNMIKPAVEAAGLRCIRADEIVHSGQIDVPMYEQLLKADVVVADLSTSNKNAFYELGVRHALRPYTTVVICEDGMKSLPFDVNHVAIRQYHHLGEDIGSSEARRFSKLLTESIKEIINKDPRDKDSPVYTFLNGLKAPEIAAAIEEAVKNETETGQEKREEKKETAVDTSKTHSVMMKEVDEAQKEGDWITAKAFLSKVRKNLKSGNNEKEDPYILQRLALITYKSKFPNEKDALIEAHHLLNLLDPGTSNDTETLGLWGAVHKRLYEITKEPKHLDEAIRAYERGFFIRNDYYNGINFAFLLNVRARQETNRAEAIADFVQARRVRKEVLDICAQWLTSNPIPDGKGDSEKGLSEYLKSWYWVKATMGEAYAGMGEDANAEKELLEAFSKGPKDWMKNTTKEQIDKLRSLLKDSPLEYVIK